MEVNFRNLPHWLRGGTIAVGIYVFFSVVSFILQKFYPNFIDSSSVVENIIYFPQILGMYLVIFKSGFNFIESKIGFVQYFEIFVLGIMSYFIIGSIIGFICKKFKK